MTLTTIIDNFTSRPMLLFGIAIALGIYTAQFIGRFADKVLVAAVISVVLFALLIYLLKLIVNIKTGLLAGILIFLKWVYLGLLRWKTQTRQVMKNITGIT